MRRPGNTVNKQDGEVKVEIVQGRVRACEMYRAPRYLPLFARRLGHMDGRQIRTGHHKDFLIRRWV